jgi:hypothetical protein
MREGGNTASTGLLTTQITKVKVEITSEEQVKNNIKVYYTCSVILFDFIFNSG